MYDDTSHPHRRPVPNLAVRRLVTATLLGTSLTVTRYAEGQRAPPFTTPMLAGDHWAVIAARRAAMLGLAPERFAWGDGSITQASAGWVILAAADSAARADLPLRNTLQSEWERFAHEFPGVAARLSDSDPQDQRRPAEFLTRNGITSSIAARVVTADNRLLPVRSLDRTRENFAPPTPIGSLGDADLRVQVGAQLGRYAAAEVGAGRADEDWRVRDWQLVAGAKSLGFWGGERAPDFGPGVGGGLVFDGRAAFTGGGLGLTNPVRLPWLFRYLGYARGEMFLSRVDSNAATRHPWVFASHLSITPHPRLLLGATQAFMFSGEGLPPFTWRNFKEMFLTHGIKVAGSEFENGIASLEAQWRPPLPKIPAVLYVEWGADDNHSALFRFPAVVTGLRIPSLPNAPAVSIGIERTSFAKPCSGCDGCACEYYATWYRHYVFMDGWTVDRQPIGHPLGGDGTEWLVYGRFDDARRRLRVETRGFVRDRGRFNLYSPTREGESVGGVLGAEYRLTRTIEFHVDAMAERGRGDWSTSSFGAGVRWVP